MESKKDLVRRFFDLLRKDYPGRRFVISADASGVLEIKRRRPVGKIA